MTRILWRIAPIVALALTACTGQNQVILPPPGSTALQRLYVADFQISGTVRFFQLPVSNTSTSAGSFAAMNDPVGMCQRPSGTLFVANSHSPNIEAFAQPITNSSSGAFTLTDVRFNRPRDCAFDGNGNMYVADSVANGGEVFVYTSPVTSGSTVNSTITTSVAFPWGITADASGDVFIVNSNNISEYSPLGSGNSHLATFGREFDNFGIRIGPDGNLYVANGGADGSIDVYKPPFSNASTFDHTINPPGAVTLHYMVFDSSGNFYVSGDTATASVVWVFAPPYTGAPTATVTVANAVGFAYGLAIGQ